MMLENTTPVMKSTLSRLMFFSNSCLATSGLNWSSLTSTSAGSPPSLPPLSLTASRKPSRMSTPRAEEGPDSVLTKPTLTLSAAWASGTATARQLVARAMARLVAHGLQVVWNAINKVKHVARTKDNLACE